MRPFLLFLINDRRRDEHEDIVSSWLVVNGNMKSILPSSVVGSLKKYTPIESSRYTFEHVHIAAFLRTSGTQATFKLGTLLLTGESEEFSCNAPEESTDAPSICRFSMVIVALALGT